MLSLAVLGAAAALLGASAVTASAKPRLGLADQSPATFLDKRFRSSGIKRVRVLISYDQIRRGGPLFARQDAYLNEAHQQGLSVLVSWYRTSSCSPQCAAKRLPSVGTFRSDFRRFRKRYPWVRRFSTWNEMNFPQAEPTGHHPGITARYYRMLRRECSGGRCGVLTGDFRANGSKFDERWLRTFKRGIGGGSHAWGLISHPEVNELHTRYTRKFLRSVRGPVYVNEVGAINFFRRVHKPSLKRQNKVMRFILGPYSRVSRRIREMYIYHWRAAPNDQHWDSALLSKSGKRRPAYFTFFRGFGHKAP